VHIALSVPKDMKNGWVHLRRWHPVQRASLISLKLYDTLRTLSREHVHISASTTQHVPASTVTIHAHYRDHRPKHLSSTEVRTGHNAEGKPQRRYRRPPASCKSCT
jgi:hypothetical protein